jgi:hypothetical protein
MAPRARAKSGKARPKETTKVLPLMAKATPGKAQLIEQMKVLAKKLSEKETAKPTKRKIKSYVHSDKQRVNNPPVGLVTPDTDKDAGNKEYAYDPHLDPQLVWAGKAEHTSFEVPTVSLHVHERIDPRSIIEVVRRRNGTQPQLSLFALPEENPPIRAAIESTNTSKIGPIVSSPATACSL